MGLELPTDTGSCFKITLVKLHTGLVFCVIIYFNLIYNSNLISSKIAFALTAVKIITPT